MQLNIKVAPRSSRNGIVGWMGETLKLCVTAPPQRGQANQAACALLAEALGIAKKSIRIVSGVGSTRKRVEIEGLDMTDIRRRLAYASARD